jgi:hypothetical protein
MKALNKNFWITTIFIFTAVLLRLLFNQMQWWNFSPIMAMSFFAGYTYKDKRFSFAIPIFAMLLSDLIIGLHAGMFVIYVTMCLACIIGILISGKSKYHIIGGSILGSLLFYLITNLVIWYSPELYPLSWEGQIQSYIAALPFFKSSLLSDLLFTVLFFGSYQLITHSKTQVHKA